MTDKFGNPVKGDSFDITELKTAYIYDSRDNMTNQQFLANNIPQTEDIYTYNSANLLVDEVHKKRQFYLRCQFLRI